MSVIETRFRWRVSTSRLWQILRRTGFPSFFKDDCPSQKLIFFASSLQRAPLHNRIFTKKWLAIFFFGQTREQVPRCDLTIHRHTVLCFIHNVAFLEYIEKSLFTRKFPSNMVKLCIITPIESSVAHYGSSGGSSQEQLWLIWEQ